MSSARDFVQRLNAREFEPAAVPGPSGEDVLLADNGLDLSAPFCSNPHCALHLRLSELQLAGGGNWVSLADGRVFGRGRFAGRMYCDACGTRRGPVRLAG